MGKLKEELRKIYHKKRKKAKEQLKLYEEGKIPFSKLNRLAKKIFYKRLKAGYKFQIKKPEGEANQSS
ncbi:MAG: hypothetical protein DRP67_04920 [Candidatus Omnitrophota bacterium]|nr:MAG: hypothetical protein DRP67_04920 [Candidatus Omnitrophota bacterium]